MIVFKTFLKVLNKNKFIVIMYTAILIFFAVFNMQTSDTSLNFVASKPDIAIINKDDEKGITKSLIEYLKEKCNLIELENTENSYRDALFYRKINYLITIPTNFHTKFLNTNQEKIEIKSTKDYQASLAEMYLNRYLEVASLYKTFIKEEKELITKIEDTLKKETKVEITSTLDNTTLSKITYYYNFANYTMLASCIYIICFVLSSFKEEKIKKRTTISAMSYKKQNHYLLLANSLFTFTLWIFYCLLGYILIGKQMFSLHGIFYLINSFLFMGCALTFAFLLSNLITNKNALSGIVNVIALGSSFLCGAFVPTKWLPPFVLKIAHILPSYYFINTNEIVENLENFHWENLKPILQNFGVIITFILGFIILNNYIFRKKQILN